MDQLIPFMINEVPVRGRIVRLEQVVDDILKRHAYPQAISHWLAECLTIAAMLASNLKTDGILTLQLQSKGALSLLVVDAAHGGALRGYADFDAEKIATLDNPSLTSLCVDGYLAMTLDPGEGGARYQGIVPLAGEMITDIVQGYFTQSQQLSAQFHVAVGTQLVPKADAKWIAAGVYIERLPDAEDKEADEDGWHRSRALLSTLRDDELLDHDLPLEDILHRLFHEDGVWVYPAQGLSAACRCSREKIEQTLRSMPESSLEEMRVEGVITVHCQFCNSDYVFE